MCVSSFLPLWVVSLNSDRHNSGPKFLNAGCEKKENKKEPQKRGGGKGGAKKADTCNILCIYPTLNF